MFDSEADFCTNISNLVSYLSYLEAREKFVKNIIRKHSADAFIQDEVDRYLTSVESSSVITAKRFTYTNSIISLYGYLERYLEDITTEFVQKINAVDIPFSALPKEVRRSHLDFSMDLVKKLQRSRSHNSVDKDKRIKTILFNMHACVEEFDSYQLNEEAFSLHSANFRYDSIHNHFCNIGIHGVPRLTIRENNMKRAISKKHAIEPNVEDKVFISLLAADLNDLAQRRNEIAHGSYNGELESIDMVIERALCLKEFGCSVGKILEKYFYESIFESTSKISLGLPAKAFVGNKVFGFNANSCGSAGTINIGDTLFARSDGSIDRLKYGKIVSIVKNNKSAECLTIPCDTEFAIKVDLDFNSRMVNREIYTLS